MQAVVKKRKENKATYYYSLAVSASAKRAGDIDELDIPFSDRKIRGWPKFL